MVKLNKILEACETLVLKSNVSILEEAATSGLSDADVAKSKLIIHENIKYIKEQLISGRILESSQNLLASNWTQAILEDMSLADIVDQGQEYTNKVAGGAQGVGHGIAALGGHAVGSLKSGNFGNADYSGAPEFIGNMAKAGYEQGYHSNANIGDTYNAAEFVGEHPVGAGLAVGGGLAAAGLGAAGAVKAASNPAVQQAVKNQVGAAAAGYNGVQGPAKPGTGAAYKAGSTIGKVRRIIK